MLKKLTKNELIELYYNLNTNKSIEDFDFVYCSKTEIIEYIFQKSVGEMEEKQELEYKVIKLERLLMNLKNIQDNPFAWEGHTANMKMLSDELHKLREEKQEAKEKYQELKDENEYNKQKYQELKDELSRE